MDERRQISRILSEIEQRMRQLEIHYEQYFGGVEKRAPMQEREELARLLRQFANRHIIQTNLRFRYQNLASRFHSYCGHWDRILRLMDEGKFERGSGRVSAPKSAPLPTAAESDRVAQVYRDLRAAYEETGSGRPPEREQVEEFLARQEEKIRRKFGDRDVEFRVVAEGGKPKIKVRARK